MKQAPQSPGLQTGTLRVARLHFLYVAALIVQIIAYDAWKLITPTTVMQRWIVTAILLVVTTVVWFIAKNKPVAAQAYRNLIYTLVITDILVASFAVYSQRGMASRAVLLYVIPIITSAVLARRSAIIAATILSVAAYTTTAVSYFVLHFNEGYKIELYGEVGFYSAMLFVVGLLTWAITRRQHKN